MLKFKQKNLRWPAFKCENDEECEHGVGDVVKIELRVSPNSLDYIGWTAVLVFNKESSEKEKMKVTLATKQKFFSIIQPQIQTAIMRGIILLCRGSEPICGGAWAFKALPGISKSQQHRQLFRQSAKSLNAQEDHPATSP